MMFEDPSEPEIARAQRFLKKPGEIEAWRWTGEEPSHAFLAWIDSASLPSDGVHVGGVPSVPEAEAT